MKLLIGLVLLLAFNSILGFAGNKKAKVFSPTEVAQAMKELESINRYRSELGMSEVKIQDYLNSKSSP